MTGARFPSCQAWHGLVSSGRRTGQTSGARRCKHLKARLAGTGLSKLLCTTNLKALILMPYCMKQSRFRGTPLKINSYQHGFKNTSQHSHHGSSILLQSPIQVHFWAGSLSSLEDCHPSPIAEETSREGLERQLDTQGKVQGRPPGQRQHGAARGASERASSGAHPVAPGSYPARSTLHC